MNGEQNVLVEASTTVWDSFDKLPPEMMMAVIFLIFIFQLIKFGTDYIYRIRREKGERTKEQSEQGITHYTIYQKLSDHHSMLCDVKDSMKKIENDFRLHTQSDAEIATTFIKRLDRIDEKIDDCKTKIDNVNKEGS